MRAVNVLQLAAQEENWLKRWEEKYTLHRGAWNQSKRKELN
jgi:hypothetical protein